MASSNEHSGFVDRSPQSTRYHAKITPNTLASAYTEADYFARNVCTIKVFVDRDAVTSGAVASANQPWQYYDLAHGYCTFNFLRTVPTRDGLCEL